MGLHGRSLSVAGETFHLTSDLLSILLLKFNEPRGDTKAAIISTIVHCSVNACLIIQSINRLLYPSHVNPHTADSLIISGCTGIAFSAVLYYAYNRSCPCLPYEAEECASLVNGGRHLLAYSAAKLHIIADFASSILTVSAGTIVQEYAHADPICSLSSGIIGIAIALPVAKDLYIAYATPRSLECI